jgi:hypothetical protein
MKQVIKQWRKAICLMLAAIFVLGLVNMDVFAAEGDVWTREDVVAHNRKIWDAQKSDPETLRLYLMPTVLSPSEKPEIIQKAFEITADIDSDYEKARAICNWVAENVYYNYDYDEDTAISNIWHWDFSVMLYAQCNHYSWLAVALLRAIGIPAKGITGSSVKGELPMATRKGPFGGEILGGAHVWIAFWDYDSRRWVMSDPTWMSRNRLEGGQYKKNTNDKAEGTYFDMDFEQLSLQHGFSINPGGGERRVDENDAEMNYLGFAPEQCWADTAVPHIDVIDIRASSKKMDGESVWVTYLNVSPIPSPKSQLTNAVRINGKNYNAPSYVFGGNNYFRWRDIATLLSGTEKQFDIGYDGTVVITTGKPYTVIGGELQPIAGMDDVRSVDYPKAIFTIDSKVAWLRSYDVNGGNNYVKMRDVGIKLNFYVGYENGTIVIDTARPYDFAS